MTLAGARGVLAVLAFITIVGGCRLAPEPEPPKMAAAETVRAVAERPPEMSTSLASLRRGEWPAYAGTYASAKYSPLDQIDRTNVRTLRIAWRWRSPDHAVRERPNATIDPSWLNEATPLMVGGVLYTTTSLSQVAAIDAVTGETKWVFDPGVYKYGMPANNGWLHRGVAYWRDGDDERIIMLAAHGFMIALDAKSGRPITSFGVEGWVDLSQGLGRPVRHRSLYSTTSPPVIVRDVIVVGSSITDFPIRPDLPPGDVRGFDVRTGKKLWTFHAVPRPGEVGHETWAEDAWKTIGGGNVWTLMSADEELGYVYLPFSTPANDYYGGHRHGDNLFGESLVCVEARTGKRVWHYQLVRHGLWDYDLPAAPNLIDVTIGGRRVKAVAQATKQGFVFVFDRVTGQPIWPIEDRPVPQSSVPGEKSAATQPFPTKPLPFEIQGVREEDLIDFTPELRQQALGIIRRYDHGPLYTPPTEHGVIAMPGVGGGASWSGGAWDPETGIYYVTTVRTPFVVNLFPPPATISGDRYVGRFGYLPGPRRLPLFKPPWGSLVAIDMTTGDHLWRAPVGRGNTHPALGDLRISERLGWPFRSFVVVTKSLLFVVQSGFQSSSRPSPFEPTRRIFELSNREPTLSAFDKATGALIAEIPLPANASGSPMTYMAGGKQYVAFPVGGSNVPEELIAVTLP